MCRWSEFNGLHVLLTDYPHQSNSDDMQNLNLQIIASTKRIIGHFYPLLSKIL